MKHSPQTVTSARYPRLACRSDRRLTILYVRGVWNGHRIISESWASESVKPHAKARPDTDYGYLWWLQTFRAEGRAWPSWGMYGTGGNKVLVFPESQMTVVITTTNYRVPGASTLTDKLLVDYILKAVK